MSKQPVDEKILKDAQYRKGLSIAFFNATNAAIAMATSMKFKDSSEALEKIVILRDFFLDEHKNYYATVIANVGVNYKADETIAKLKEIKTLEDLKIAWALLSADERHDGEIIKVVQELKKKYNEKA